MQSCHLNLVSSDTAKLKGIALTLLAWYCDGEKLVPNGRTNFCQKFGICVDLIRLCCIQHLLVVTTVTTRVLPIDISEQSAKIYQASSSMSVLTNSIGASICKHGCNIVCELLHGGVRL
jgi:hypothetical protein